MLRGSSIDATTVRGQSSIRLGDGRRMLPTNPQRPRISTRKVYGHLLPSEHVESMKAVDRNGRVSRKVSPPYRQIHVSEACMIISSKEFPSSKKSLRTLSQYSDWCASMDNQDAENGRPNNFTLANRNRSNHEPRNRGPQSLRKPLSLGNCLNNDHGFWLFFFLSLLFACGNCQTNNNDQWAPGIRTVGRTWPKGDIVLEHGQPLRIYCMLDETLTDPEYSGKNASDLVFFRSGKKLESEYVEVVNATTSMLYVENLPPSKNMYKCKLRLNGDHGNKYALVGLNMVSLGFKPQKPLAFSCISRNWENLTCTWEPKPNHIVTHYFLGLKLHGRAGARQFYPCPKRNSQQDSSNLPPNTCLWDASTDPIYRLVYEYYTFVLEAENVLGKDRFTYKIHHWAHVIPAQPVDLKLVSKTYSSALLHWEIPDAMRSFPPGLYHRVSYASKYDPENWTSIDITEKPRNNSRYFNLTKLEYANTMYDIRVFMKSAKAIDEDSWSEFKNITVKTAATLPGEPPKTTVGSFEIADYSKGRDVYIYWQQIPVYLQNGEHFTYRIVSVEEDGKQSDKQPSEIKDAYAKFEKISFECFKFEIVATNALGDSRERATVYVPRYLDKPPEPVAFTKIAFEEGLYELSWIPMRDQNIVNYTIFWCENERDRPYQCNGYLDWEYVAANVSIHNTTVPDKSKIYQFAIAANTAHASSGMVWASCTAIHNKTIGKMKSVWINSITSDKIQVGWRLECSDRIDVIKGFVIYYCPIVSPYNVTCKNPMMNTTVEGGLHTINGDLTGLKPYTTYKLTVAVLTKNAEGQYSDPLYSTTLEAAPTPPRHINVTDVTNTTITLEWKPPAAINGVLRYYTVYYNDDVMRVENGTEVQIQCLEPHTDYKISVSAWTDIEGNRSEPIFRKTHGGLPGEPDLPKIRFINASQVHITWNPPSNAGGNLDYYEILTADNHIHSNITTCKTVCENLEKHQQYATGDPEKVLVDPEIFDILGIKDTKDKYEAGAIDSDLIRIWHKLINEGLSKKEKEKLLEKYKRIPEFEAKKLNAEILASLAPENAIKDTNMADLQKLIGSSLMAIGSVLTVLMSEDECDKLLLLKTLNDVATINIATHHAISVSREANIFIPDLTPQTAELIRNGEMHYTLHGNNLGERIREPKDLTKLSQDIGQKTALAPPSASRNSPRRQR